MSEFSKEIANLRYKADNRVELEQIIKTLEGNYRDKYKQYETMLRAQQVLATVSDSNSKRVLGYIQGVINKALRTMFPNDTYNIVVEKKLYNNTIPHINTVLTEVLPNGQTHQLDFSLQSGDGMGQIVSFLFSLCLMKIREARPLVILDEVLKGFHEEALPIVREIIEIFAKGGFQFIVVEYDLKGLGKEYEVIKKNGIAGLVVMDRDSDLEFDGESYEEVEKDDEDDFDEHEESEVELQTQTVE
ncbi:ATP-binding protein [Bacillus toyonensis]|uniref:ATP-binding protein n=1 Tax=Bacillus toyonensis TaxID=155322 RepID=UPI0020D279B6|nr:ATP-binding protein [Bacillus toyonensis]